MTICKAAIRFGDNYRDAISFHCQLKEGHKGLHRERGCVVTIDSDVPYILSWDVQKREVKK